MNLKQRIHAIADLPHPGNYRVGLSFARTSCPDHILFFSRTRGIQLTANLKRNHHHRYLLILAIKGSGKIILDQQTIQLTRNTGILIHPLQFHHYAEVEENISWLFITFEGGNLRDFQDWQNKTVSIDNRALQLMDLCMDSWKHSEKSPISKQLPLNLALLLLHLSGLSDKQKEEVKTPISTLQQNVETRLKKTNPAHWNLPSLALSLGISERHLRRRFLAETGIAIGRYLQEKKMIRAMSALHEGKRVTEVAELSGYSNIYVFSRAFHRLIGLPPSRYKKGKTIFRKPHLHEDQRLRKHN